MENSKSRLDSKNKSHENSPFTSSNGGFDDGSNAQITTVTWVTSDSCPMCDGAWRWSSDVRRQLEMT